MADAKVEHVSDTALWVAHYRAQESRRPDALFSDPLAERLVGERGRAIARDIGYPGPMSQVLVLRTLAIDALVRQAVAEGAELVVNLGAGLDTRPYRMEGLPSTLRWVEADFPHMVEYKNQMLAGEVPRVPFERVAIDLSADDARQAFLKRLGAGVKRAVVITEGVIPYLTNTQAAALAHDIYAEPVFQFWVMDFQDWGLKNEPNRRLARKLKKSPFRFDAPSYTGFFAPHGWRLRKKLGLWSESERIGRPLYQVHPPVSWVLRFAPRWVRKSWDERMGSLMLERT